MTFFLTINQKSHYFPAIAHEHNFYLLCIKFVNKLMYYNFDNFFKCLILG